MVRGNIKDLAVRYMKVGAKKVWLDPTKMDLIRKTTTREGIRDLISQGIIKRKFTPGGSWKQSRSPFFVPKDTVFKLNNNNSNNNNNNNNSNNNPITE